MSKPEIGETVKSAIGGLFLGVAVADLPHVGTLLVHEVDLVEFDAALLSAYYVLVDLDIALDATYHKFILDVVNVFEQP